MGFARGIAMYKLKKGFAEFHVRQPLTQTNIHKRRHAGADDMDRRGPNRYWQNENYRPNWPVFEAQETCQPNEMHVSTICKTILKARSYYIACRARDCDGNDRRLSGEKQRKVYGLCPIHTVCQPYKPDIKIRTAMSLARMGPSRLGRLKHRKPELQPGNLVALAEAMRRLGHDVSFSELSDILQSNDPLRPRVSCVPKLPSPQLQHANVLERTTAGTLIVTESIIGSLAPMDDSEADLHIFSFDALRPVVTLPRLDSHAVPLTEPSAVGTQPSLSRNTRRPDPTGIDDFTLDELGGMRSTDMSLTVPPPITQMEISTGSAAESVWNDDVYLDFDYSVPAVLTPGVSDGDDDDDAMPLQSMSVPQADRQLCHSAEPSSTGTPSAESSLSSSWPSTQSDLMPTEPLASLACLFDSTHIPTAGDTLQVLFELEAAPPPGSFVLWNVTTPAAFFAGGASLQLP